MSGTAGAWPSRSATALGGQEGDVRRPGRPRLRRVMKHAADRFRTVPDPRLAVLRDTPRLFIAVRIYLT
jgi:hypothetical protein